ncbi:MAG TPA: tRNA uridine-5-carboxymethylaminomethyl(34) synthesis enzyme MnmG, partial [Myxococcaceae bacterium]|nr:tRNA uridine-5-carboxymethylaminomethyl(34) synthesis enzyme MnmG [Myxococcaceae bacterium]
HLVREIDALGGEMASAADDSGTHFKTLNASKGPAVRASRVLCDRDRYASRMRQAVSAAAGLTVVEGEVSRLLAEGGRVTGVELADKANYSAKAVILTTGTFLQALIHLGGRQEVGGRLGDAAASGLSGSLKALGFELGRFKTGTPARLARSSIDWSRCELEAGDASPRPLSLRTSLAAFPAQPHVDCFVTFTTPQTHGWVRDNLGRSPLFAGAIRGRGPRYCPSLEDKVVRFPQRERHAVFLEPEGPSSPLVYPAGLSTSLPPDVQDGFLRTIPGLENVEVVRHGYAVEYDFAPPTQLQATLETRRVRGLYFAGQLNGTSGYEEAGVQGLLAGINAALAVRGEPPLLLRRDEAHAGVLVDELVVRGVDEPFRMLTSRSEHRLRLREGNADLRLRAHGFRVGLVSRAEADAASARARAVRAEVARLERAGLASMLRRPEVGYASLAEVDPSRPALPGDVTEEVEVEVKYAGYIRQQDRAAARGAEACDGWKIPAGFAFEGVRGLSSEAREKLSRHQPSTVAQARRIPGITPAAVSLLLVHLRRDGTRV